jgi:hypothetical protein
MLSADGAVWTLTAGLKEGWLIADEQSQAGAIPAELPPGTTREEWEAELARCDRSAAASATRSAQIRRLLGAPEAAADAGSAPWPCKRVAAAWDERGRVMGTVPVCAELRRLAAPSRASDAPVTKEPAATPQKAAGQIVSAFSDPDPGDENPAVLYGVLARLRDKLPLGTILYTRPARASDVSATAGHAEAAGWREPADNEILALNRGEIHFSESPTKFPEAGHGTQYHAGAPGVLSFARAAIALAKARQAEPPLADDGREAVRTAIAEALGDAMDCTRVWEAWRVGTMTDRDFSLVAEDDGRLSEITDAAITAFARYATTVRSEVSVAQALAALPKACSTIYTDYERGYNKALGHTRENLRALAKTLGTPVDGGAA